MVYVATLILAFYSFSPILAKEKAQIEVKVEEEKEAELDTTSHAQVILPSEWKGQAQTVPQLLEKGGGVQLKQYGGLDDFAAVSIRGSTTEQVLIYLDGVLLNSAHGGILDLSMIPIDQIERIEVYKGGAPGKSVDSAPGGVIYIQTKQKIKKTENVLRNSFGSFTTYRGHIGRSQNLKPFYYNAAFDHHRSRGDFPFLDNRGTRANTSDDRTRNRQNNDFQAYDFATTIGGNKEESLQWKVYENFFLKQAGIPGFGARTSSQARLDTLKNIFHLELGAPTKSEKKLRWKTDLSFDYLNSQFQDRSGQIGLGTQDNNDDTFRFGPELHLTWLPDSFAPGNHVISGFVAHRAEFFKPTNNTASPPNGPLSQRHMIGTGLEDEISLLEDKINFTPSIRHQTFLNNLSGQDPSSATQNQDNNATDSQISAKVGLKVSPWRFLSFKTNLTRGFRQPTFTELFGDRGTILGNSALQAEKSFNFDFGVELKQKNLGFIDSLNLSAAYFRNTIDNLIQFLQTSQFTIRADNINSAQILGGEFSIALRAFKNLKGSAHYTYQTAKDSEESSPTFGRFLPGRPKHQFFAEADYQFPYVRPFIEVQIMGNNYLDSQNLLRVTRRTLLASGLHLNPLKWLEASLSAKNILNDRIEDVVGYPLPGRSYWGEVTFNF